MEGRRFQNVNTFSLILRILYLYKTKHDQTHLPFLPSNFPQILPNLVPFHLISFCLFVNLLKVQLLPHSRTVPGTWLGQQGNKTHTDRKLGSRELGSLLEKPQHPRSLTRLLDRVNREVGPKHMAAQELGYYGQINKEAEFTQLNQGDKFS